MSDIERPIAVFYEHPDWFRPLFDALDDRGVPWTPVDARSHAFDPGGETPEWSLVFNRMSPSSYLRGLPGGVAYGRAWLAHLEARGVRVVNGTDAFRVETSKAVQLSLLDGLGLDFPPSRVVHTPGEVAAAAEELRTPVVVKADLGGSGAGITRYDDLAGLRAAAEDGELEFGPDGTALVQEFVPRRDGTITRVETLGGEYLYAIRVRAAEDCFDLCPADIPSGDGGEADERGRAVEPVEPPPGVIRDVERIVRAGGLEVGGVEYMVDDRDGTVRYYDVNALSNFVADAEELLGFDPFHRLADYLVREARRAERPGPRSPGRPSAVPYSTAVEATLDAQGRGTRERT